MGIDGGAVVDDQALICVGSLFRNESGRRDERRWLALTVLESVSKRIDVTFRYSFRNESHDQGATALPTRFR